MEIDLGERIRQRAYELWEDSGRPAGGAEEFWHRAEQELKGGQGPEPAPPLFPD